MIFFLVPVFNEEKNIPNLYRELSELTLAEEFYFVFSDDGSSDSSKQIIRELFPASQIMILVMVLIEDLVPLLMPGLNGFCSKPNLLTTVLLR